MPELVDSLSHAASQAPYNLLGGLPLLSSSIAAGAVTAPAAAATAAASLSSACMQLLHGSSATATSCPDTLPAMGQLDAPAIVMSLQDLLMSLVFGNAPAEAAETAIAAAGAANETAAAATAVLDLVDPISAPEPVSNNSVNGDFAALGVGLVSAPLMAAGMAIPALIVRLLVSAQ